MNSVNPQKNLQVVWFPKVLEKLNIPNYIWLDIYSMPSQVNAKRYQLEVVMEMCF